LIEHAEHSATRYLGLLYILKNEGYELAKILLKQSEDLNILSSLFLQYRELEAKARSLYQAYICRDIDVVNNSLIDLYVLFSPLSGGFSLGSDILKNIPVDADSLVCFPTLSGVVAVNKDNNLGSIVEQVINLLCNNKYDDITWISDSFTRSGIRISTAMNQPAVAGNEFNLIEKNYIDDLAAVNNRHNEIRFCLDLLPLLDMGLSISINRVMKVYTVLPRYSPTTRKAGSVSLLPGWAWQDFDSEIDRLEERCHLSVQMVHEFFHTKVNLVEKHVRLYTTDGNSPQVFSPWKNRYRPLRQVIHALMTFSAGAAVWAKLISFPWLSFEKLSWQAENYWVETLRFADLAYQDLIMSEALTDAGKILITACIDNLKFTCNAR
ncbi:MAG: HEXXH motif-containing putative peptide modification protein, partial [Geitlerinemataceae cyanobacterium]